MEGEHSNGWIDIENMVIEINRMLDILSFWHKIEFFIPFDLDGRLREQDDRKTFWRRRRDPSSLVFADPPKGKAVSGYTLYLGVFDKNDVQDVIGRTVPRDDFEYIEEQQRADLNGRTCIASLRLDANTCPLFDSVEVSTLPWAVGRVGTGGLDALSSEAFSRARQGLSNDIHNFESQRCPADPGNIGHIPLRPTEVGALARLFSDWAGFSPDHTHPEAALEVCFKDAKKKSDSAEPAIESDAAEDDEDETDDDYRVGILNSFYVDDLEMAMADVAAGRLSKALRCFLTPLAATQRQDLYSADGHKRITETLEPARINRGRWLSDPDHSMSLMQQFAINTAKERLARGGLASVNGPPGTGKTTLLRDIIADNVVARARVLAGLDRARDAFIHDKITIAGGTGQITISQLIPELTGYEMVVASSNNAAVENISRDLPKRASIDGDGKSGYLQRVAHKVAAQKGNGQCRALSKGDMPWGLIACALGRKANRTAFALRCFGFPVDPQSPKTWAGDERPLTLWEWRSEAKVAPFAEAARAFRSADAEVEALIAQLTQFCDLHRRIVGHTEQSFCADAQLSLENVRQEEVAAEAALHLGQHEFEAARAALTALREEERLLDRTSPVWWLRMIGARAAREYRARVQANAGAQIVKAREVADLEQNVLPKLEAASRRAKQTVRSAETRLLAAKNEWSNHARSYRDFVERFGAIAPPANLDDLETDSFQKRGLWHVGQFAQLRSDLFRVALGLHEAWLAEVSVKGGGFGGNLFACSEMLQRNIGGDAKALQAVWQSFFMVVPVASSTFASFARQFRGLGPESIGWLFIDEAGQAVPQAAVGALHRAKRALVIGDPLQIEPVFTLPKRLIAELAALSPHTRDGTYSPDAVSVQFRADAGNPLGTKVQAEGDNEIWIGSPLRVHRRCIDPMFSVANAIAYQNKMIFGLAQRLPCPDIAPLYGDSAWIDISGRVEGHQTVREQIDFVAQLIGATHAEYGQLPDLYVISPFKEVKENLIQEMRQSPRIWGEASPPRRGRLGAWLTARVGTVHTFQGKEEDTVIMVLGADARTQGAARWAASKPNILNVALTRAKRRFYMVGNRTLWAGLPFFSNAASVLPSVTQDDFMLHVTAAWRARSR